MYATLHYSGNLRQRGAALMVMLVILIIGGTVFLVSSLNSASLQIARDQATANALAQAKQALIGYAVKVQLSNSSLCSPNCPRPGDLPCPDTNNDGSAESSCGNADGSSGQTLRLGRLPWRTLGLPDLRDGGGERLWYAVSNSFKNNTRTSCNSPGEPGCLNSDTAGTITVRSPDGNVIHDATLGTGAAAIIIAPGGVLTRQGAATPQNRSCTIGVDCDATGKCITTPPTSTPKCDPANYLDVFNDYLDTISGTYPHTLLNDDNASFADGASDGFIQGKIKFRSDLPSDSDRVIINDQLLVVTQNNIMQPAQKRVAAEVKLCLEDYAGNNNGRYPWAAPITDLGSTYNDNQDTYFGRVPDNLDNTRSESIDTMDNRWGTCNTHSNNTPSGWWINWKEKVFYGVARRFRPNNTGAPSFPSTCSTPGNCLNINSPNTPAKFAVIVAGNKLAGQARNSSGEKSAASNYLEGGNENADQSGGHTFIQTVPSATFNDTLVYQ